MPLPLVEAELANGTLVRLDLPDHQGGNFRFSGIWRRDAPPGPAATWLLRRFAELGEGDRNEDAADL